MDVTKIPIHHLNAAPYNPRVELRPGDAVFDNLKRSIETFGYLQPIIVNRRNHTVVGGHQRLKVLKDLGYQEVGVVFVDLSAEHEKAFNLTLNKTVGEWNELKLARLLQEFEGFPDVDVQLAGFDAGEIGDLISRVLDRETATGNDDDFDPEAALDWNRPAVTEKGELLELGDHRLLCGGATNAEDVRRLMKAQRAALFMTGPPYLVGYDGSNHRVSKAQRSASKRKNKNWSGSYGVTWDDADANPDLYENFYRVAVAEAVAPNAAWYCWHASRRQAMVESVWVKFGAFVHEQIIWVKDRPVLGRSWYSWQHEPCFLGWVRPHRPDRVADDFLSTVWQVPAVAPGRGAATGSIQGRCAGPAIFVQPILRLFGASDNRPLEQ